MARRASELTLFHSGKDVNIYGNGTGTIDGAGQAWWEAFASNASLLRPILFVTDGLEGGSITGLNLVNSPNVRHELTKLGTIMSPY